MDALRSIEVAIRVLAAPRSLNGYHISDAIQSDQRRIYVKQPTDVQPDTRPFGLATWREFGWDMATALAAKFCAYEQGKWYE
jgi:hypothetical protein